MNVCVCVFFSKFLFLTYIFYYFIFLLVPIDPNVPDVPFGTGLMDKSDNLSIAPPSPRQTDLSQIGRNNAVATPLSLPGNIAMPTQWSLDGTTNNNMNNNYGETLSNYQ